MHVDLDGSHKLWRFAERKEWGVVPRIYVKKKVLNVGPNMWFSFIIISVVCVSVLATVCFDYFTFHSILFCKQCIFWLFLSNLTSWHTWLLLSSYWPTQLTISENKTYLFLKHTATNWLNFVMTDPTKHTHNNTHLSKAAFFQPWCLFFWYAQSPMRQVPVKELSKKQQEIWANHKKKQ